MIPDTNGAGFQLHNEEPEAKAYRRAKFVAWCALVAVGIVVAGAVL
jgi:hypothetical protein